MPWKTSQLIDLYKCVYSRSLGVFHSNQTNPQLLTGTSLIMWPHRFKPVKAAGGGGESIRAQVLPAGLGAEVAPTHKDFLTHIFLLTCFSFNAQSVNSVLKLMRGMRQCCCSRKKQVDTSFVYDSNTLGSETNKGVYFVFVIIIIITTIKNHLWCCVSLLPLSSVTTKCHQELTNWFIYSLFNK